MPPTMRAHCGACSGLIILVTLCGEAWFICLDCDYETEHRATVAEAAEDVVWVPVTTPATTAGRLGS